MSETTQPLQMEESEICSEYKNAANKVKQIDILADLNLCQPRTIAEILVKNGLEIPKMWQERLKKPARRIKKTGPAETTVSSDSGITIGTLIALLSDLPPETPVMLDTNTTLRWVTFMREYSAETASARDTAILKG